MRGLKKAILIVLAVLVVIVLPKILVFYTDLLWFQEVGYQSIFWKTLTTKILVGGIFGLVFFLIVYANLVLAKKLSAKAPWYEHERQNRMNLSYEFEQLLERRLSTLMLIVSIIIGYVVMMNASRWWMATLAAFNPTPFGVLDPVFKKDLSFYVFQLPFWEIIRNYLSGALILTLVLSLVVHFLAKGIRTVKGVPEFSQQVKNHVSVLLVFIFILKAWDYRLQMFDLLTSERGVVFGATYTDIHARLFTLIILLAIALLCALAVLLNLRRRGFVLPVGAVVVLIIASFIGSLYPAAIQRFKVVPAEQTLEKPFIEHNIKATRLGFDLGKTRDIVFPTLTGLTSEIIDNEGPTIQNVRLWDHRPLLDVYKQKQQLQTYYQFDDVDIDRYLVGDQYRQVMLSAREINFDGLPGEGWQNEHISYTHGYGAVLSPVNEATREGDPEMMISDIPPVSDGLQDIKQPGIYYGEIATSDQFSLVHTTMEENDYPLGSSEMAKTTYSGAGGVPIGSAIRRLAMSIRFGDINLVLSENIKLESKIIFKRSIFERLSSIAPFIAYDKDPYIVISDDGKLFWMQDGYTITSNLPYSQPYPTRFGTINYIRNSVKVVVDAYNGTTTFYAVNNQDPLLQTFSKIFPDLVKPISEMPKDLYKHIRYPEELFNLQAQVITTYHMTEAQQFYRKDNRWEIAREKADKGLSMNTDFSQNKSSDGGTMDAYYVQMRLPDEKESEFILMIPFTPLNRANMVAWMAARCDPEHYGELLTVRFPRDKQVFGPIQIESNIDSHGEISRLLSLWDQRGSQVVRGNLLVIPLGHSLLYVEPIFLKAQVAAIPQLKLVVVGHQVGESIQISFGPSSNTRPSRPATGQAPPLSAETLLSGAAVPTKPKVTKPTTEPSITEVPTEPVPTDSKNQIRQALQHYDLVQERLRAGDFAGYQQELDKMAAILREMEQE